MRKRTKGLRAAVAALALGAAVCLGAIASTEEAAPALPRIEPRAAELLRQMSEALRAAKSFSVHAEIVYDEALRSGRKLQFAAALDAALRRPDGLVIEYLSDLGGKRLWYDGGTFTLLDVLQGAYATGPAPATTEAFLAMLESEQGVSFPLADLVVDDPYTRLTGAARSGLVVGPGDVAGTTCHHLAFVQDDLDWQIWIDAGERPLPHKLLITYTSLPGAPQYAAVLSDWELAKTIPDERFTARLPEEAHRVEFVKARNAAEVEP